jgi:hypothetical protein
VAGIVVGHNPVVAGHVEVININQPGVTPPLVEGWTRKRATLLVAGGIGVVGTVVIAYARPDPTPIQWVALVALLVLSIGIAASALLSSEWRARSLKIGGLLWILIAPARVFVAQHRNDHDLIAVVESEIDTLEQCVDFQCIHGVRSKINWTLKNTEFTPEVEADILIRFNAALADASKTVEIYEETAQDRQALNRCSDPECIEYLKTRLLAKVGESGLDLRRQTLLKGRVDDVVRESYARIGVPTPDASLPDASITDAPPHERIVCAANNAVGSGRVLDCTLPLDVDNMWISVGCNDGEFAVLRLSDEKGVVATVRAVCEPRMFPVHIRGHHVQLELLDGGGSDSFVSVQDWSFVR